MYQALLIALGGALGSLARFGVSTMVHGITGDVFPYGTLVVNVAGSLLIGVVAEVFDAALIPSPLRSLVTIGFLGGFTTFSTYSLETLNLLRDGEWRLAGFNVLGNNILGLCCAALGVYATRVVLRILV
jgi:CrcB protein